MELRHLKYFITVAEELNFRRAAERLYIEQPPLSRQIRQLEAEMGVELFHRSKRGVRLTAVGHVFLEKARLTLTQAEQAVQATKQFARQQRTSLTIGFSMCAFDTLLPQIVQAFRQNFAEVEVKLIEMSTPCQVQALMVQEIELGFLNLPIYQGELITETIFRDSLVVALPEGHPLTALPKVALRSLSEEPFVLFPQQVKPDLYEQIMNACQQAGFQPNIVQEATPPEVAIGFVGAGSGISLVAACYQERQSPGVVYRALEEPTPLLEIAVAWRQGSTSTVLSKFLDVVKATKAELG